MIDADTTGAGQVSHGYTYSAHPVAAAAAIATLKILQADDVPGHVARVGPAFQQRLRGLVQRVPLVGDVRGKGLMLAIEMVADQASRAPAQGQRHPRARGQGRLPARADAARVGAPPDPVAAAGHQRSRA